MRTGVYKKNSNGLFYQFLCIAREHYSGEQAVVYIPLRVQSDWAGTVRFCYVSRGDFESKFTYVGEGLPTPLGEPK